MDRERTPWELMALGIRLHLGGLSLSNTVHELGGHDVDRSRNAVHDWVHKVGLAPKSDACPDTVALDETVIWTDGQQYWLYAAVDPSTSEFLNVRLHSTRMMALTERFHGELKEKHDVEDAVFLVDSARGSRPHSNDVASRISTNTTATDTRSNVSFGGKTTNRFVFKLV